MIVDTRLKDLKNLYGRCFSGLSPLRNYLAFLALGTVVKRSCQGGADSRHDVPVAHRRKRVCSVAHEPYRSARPARPYPSVTSTRFRSGPSGRPPAFGPATTLAAMAGQTPIQHPTAHDDVSRHQDHLTTPSSSHPLLLQTATQTHRIGHDLKSLKVRWLPAVVRDTSR
jgi:hypothetical protein